MVHYILRSPGLAASRRRPLSSNVRHHKRHRRGSARSSGGGARQRSGWLAPAELRYEPAAAGNRRCGQSTIWHRGSVHLSQGLPASHALYPGPARSSESAHESQFVGRAAVGSAVGTSRNGTGCADGASAGCFRLRRVRLQRSQGNLLGRPCWGSHQCCLTPRSSGAPTAGHQARSVVRSIFPQRGPGGLPSSPA